MAYAFMHINKIKSKSKIDAAYEHNYRKSAVPNAISELKHKNQELISLPYKNGKQMNYLELWNERLSSLPAYANHLKPRSNAVLALEVLMTYSRDANDTIDVAKWKEENVKWLRETFNSNPEKYGDNVLSVMFHGDEVGNLHCHAFIQPIDTNGKLNASYYTGGKVNDKTMFAHQQDTYAKAMEGLGLERGMTGSKAKHTSIDKFYKELHWALAQVPKPKAGELATEYYERYQEGMETIAAAYLKKAKEKERSADEWVTARIQEVRNERQKKTASIQKEVEQKEKELEQLNLEIKKHSSILDKTIASKNRKIEQMDKELTQLEEKRMDTFLSYQELSYNLTAHTVLVQFKKGTVVYDTIYEIDPEYTELLHKEIQSHYLDKMQDRDFADR